MGFDKLSVIIVTVAAACCLVFFKMTCDLPREITEQRRNQIEIIKYSPSETGITYSPTPCRKPTGGDTYIICKDLPYTSTECGINMNSRDGFVVPNIVHFVWYGDMELQYYHYLAIRSAAANQKPELIMFHTNGSVPGGVWWDRVLEEITCIRVAESEAPDAIFGHELSNILHKTDLTRILVLLKYGGIYLDSDAIVLRSLDPLRRFPFTIGRSSEFSLSNSVMLSEPNSVFLREWLSLYGKFNKDKLKGIHLADFGVKLPFRMRVMDSDLSVRVEETSLQRPNPWFDGRACISHGSFDISRNYILHLHPQKSLKRDPGVLSDYRPNDLRLYDTTYGAGARAALFGTQNLIFFESEISNAHNRTNTKMIKPFPKIIGEYSILARGSV